MAVKRITPQVTSNAGAQIVFVAPDAVDGLEFNNAGGGLMLVINNANAAPSTLTLDVTKTVDGLAIPDRTFVCPASSVSIIGPFSAVFNQADGFVRVKFSAVTTLTCAVIKAG